MAEGYHLQRTYRNLSDRSLLLHAPKNVHLQKASTEVIGKRRRHSDAIAGKAGVCPVQALRPDWLGGSVSMYTFAPNALWLPHSHTTRTNEETPLTPCLKA